MYCALLWVLKQNTLFFDYFHRIPRSQEIVGTTRISTPWGIFLRQDRDLQQPHWLPISWVKRGKCQGMPWHQSLLIFSLCCPCLATILATRPQHLRLCHVCSKCCTMLPFSLSPFLPRAYWNQYHLIL